MRGSARLLAALMLAAAPARADFEAGSLGTAGSEFLNIDSGPRGIAMGGAYSALSNDAYSIYWNPAGLSQIPRMSVVAMHNEYLAGIRYQYVGYAQRINETAVVGGAVRYMDAGSITNTDINGIDLGTFRPRNYVYELGWGQSIADLTDSERDVSIGVAARYFHSDLVAHADGFAGDIGMQAHYVETRMPGHFALTVQNVGRGQKFDRVRDSTPMQVKLGGAVLPTRILTVSLDGFFPVANQPYAAAGMEMALEPSRNLKAFLRGGYNSRTQFAGLDGLRGLTLGGGILAGALSFDYAFVPFGPLGNAHRFSVGWNLPSKSSRRFRQRY